RNHKMNISLILPVYNCGNVFAAGITALMNWLEENGLSAEIIVVDDHSTDQDSIQKICSDHALQFIGLNSNQGKGHAVKVGILQASAEKIIFMDGDFPFDLSAIATVARELDGHDLAIGDRTHPDSTYPHRIAWTRKLASSILSTMIQLTGISTITDTQCGIKGFRRQAALELFPLLKEDKFAFDIELLYLAQQRGMTIARVPVSVKVQASSSVKLWRDGLDMAKLIRRLSTQKQQSA
ncbi:MAG TPA: glycosyltransferase, partial [Flavihumibacter sp.]|nr:glycosyltransferase [Flavihumibacter sp.]